MKYLKNQKSQINKSFKKNNPRNKLYKTSQKQNSIFIKKNKKI